ncbi:MAG: secretin N-terminal domain-containing protein [Akkermansiaceae bacterium]
MTKRSIKPSLQAVGRQLIIKLGTTLVVTLGVGGCTFDPQSAADNATYRAWKEVAQNAPAVPPLAPALPPLPDFHLENQEASQTTLSDPLPQITVSDLVLTRDMDVGVLLRALADAADLNIMVSENVSGSIRMNLRRESRWDRLFLAITEGSGLHYKLNDDLLRIYSEQDIKNNIAMQEALQQQLQASEKRKHSEPKQMAMVRIRYADLENLANSVRGTMQSVTEKEPTIDQKDLPETTESNFMVKADLDSGRLIMHGIPADIAKAQELIRQLDQPSYQILIEASIVQANNEIARQLGVQWGVFDSSSRGSEIGTTPRTNGQDTGSGFNSSFPAAFGAEGSGLIFGASQVRGTQLLQAQLSALQKDGRLNIISRPSITTLDQRTATIESGEERPFASAAGSGIAAVSQIEFKKAILRLEVTPHVIDQNWVKLDLNTTKDDFDDTRAIVIDGNVQVPVLTRSAVTSLYLTNGQTTVIGGLSAETESKQEDGVPFLKDIPGLGAIFRSQNDRNGFNDTLIFITPHILPRADSVLKGSAK